MRHLRKPQLFRASAAAVAGLLLWSASATQAPPRRWYKGNLHTHTLNSDGDSPPSVVARWYKENGYQFLILSDHNVLTEVEPLNAELAEPDQFLLVQGEEVTDGFKGKPVHVNAYDLANLVKPSHGDSLVATIQNNVTAIREARALPSVNHPNFGWAMTSADLLQVEGLRMIEVYNGHPTVYNRGGGGAESLEEMWDALLTSGRKVWGIAVDDAHNFKTIGRNYSNPGRGWVVVRAPSLSSSAIRAALESGDFYASTGVELTDIQTTSDEIRIVIKPPSNSKQTTLFIGPGGEVLGRSFENTAVYRFRGNEKYVRAVVQAANGDNAWVQPIFRN